MPELAWCLCCGDYCSFEANRRKEYAMLWWSAWLCMWGAICNDIHSAYWRN